MQEEKIEVVSTDMNNVTQKQSPRQSFWELVRFAVVAILIVVPIRVFVAQPFVVSGSSMYPTFKNGDYLIVDEISYYLSEPKRDDVVVFRYPGDTTKFYIKRIIGLPGETINVAGNVVTIKNDEHTETFVLDQPFVENSSNKTAHQTLKSDEYFVMGDNRSASSDSRYWGPVPEKLLIGKAFLRLLPIKQIGVMPGAYTQTE